MLGNPAIDVAIALTLMYLMLSLLCTIFNEFIATKLKLRAKSLASALEQMLDDQPLRDTFYRHGLIVTNKVATATGPQSTVSGVASAVRTMARRSPTSSPAKVGSAHASSTDIASAPAPANPDDHPTYLSGRSVALALIASLDSTKPLPGIPDIQSAVNKLPSSHIRDVLLATLTEAGNDLDKLRTSIANWFDDSMERLSGAYKRQLKWISMLTGLLVAIAFNADSFNVATTLWRDEGRRASVVAVATEATKRPTPKAGESIEDGKLRDTLESTEKTLRSLPIGWNCVAQSPTAMSAGTPEAVILGYWDCAKTKLPGIGLMQILGWMLTAAALTLGAPFWFDLLQKFVNIRGAGAKPKREDEKVTP
jgi:hypothetical protein